MTPKDSEKIRWVETFRQEDEDLHKSYIIFTAVNVAARMKLCIRFQGTAVFHWQVNGVVYHTKEEFYKAIKDIYLLKDSDDEYYNKRSCR